jgi:hypothetical protein
MFTPQELQDLQKITSVARLSSYSRFLGTTNAAEAYGAYMWSMAVSTAFSPLIQTLEIALRNALNDTLAQHHGNDWFEILATKEANMLRASGKLTGPSEGERLIQKAKDKILKRDKAERQRKGLGPLPVSYVPAWQSVLAELTFGFWVRFLSKSYWDVNANTKLWPNHLSSVFPGAPSSMHGVGKLHAAFNKAVDIRNRIHHQEPLWKNPGIVKSEDAIQFLSAQLEACLEKIDYLGNGQRDALRKYGVIAAIEELCTKESFDRFLGRGNGQHVVFHSAKKGLRLLQKNTKDNQCVWIISQGKRIQLVLRNGNRRFF